MKYTQKELLFIVERIDKQLYELSEWEQRFFASVKPLVEKGEPLSPGRAKILNGIWDKLQ